MPENNVNLTEEEEAFLLLTTDEEKEYFKEILKLEKEEDGLISKKCPRLTVSYYVYRYKEKNRDLKEYLRDTENELAIFKGELAAKKSDFKGRESAYRQRTKRLSEETERERKIGRKRNFRYAIILLIIVFMFLAINYLK